MGDFNCVLEVKDKSGGHPVATSSRNGLRRIIDNLGLIDIGFLGKPFTWNNRRGGTENIQERLDRCYANESWRLNFPRANILHLVALTSDHSPLLLNTHPPTEFLPRPFRFETMWTLDPEAAVVIQDVWYKGFSLVSKLKNTTVALKDWNRSSFGHVQTSIKQLKKMIL